MFQVFERVTRRLANGEWERDMIEVEGCEFADADEAGLWAARFEDTDGRVLTFFEPDGPGCVVRLERHFCVATWAQWRHEMLGADTLEEALEPFGAEWQREQAERV